MLSTDQLHNVQILVIGILITGGIASLWMACSLMIKIHQAKACTQDPIVYKVLLMIALADIVATVFSILKKLCLISEAPIFIYMKSDQFLWVIIRQVYYIMMLMTLFWEAVLILQVYFMTWRTQVKRFIFEFKWLNLIIFLGLLIRFLIMSLPIGPLFDLVFFMLVGFFFFVMVLLLLYQQYNGKVNNRLRNIVKRIMLFPLLYLICFFPVTIVNVTKYLNSQSLDGFTPLPYNHPAIVVIDILRHSFFLFNAFVYGASQKCLSRKCKTTPTGNLNMSIFIDPKHIEFDLENSIGYGSMGVVYKGLYRGSTVTIKHFRLPSCTNTRAYQPFLNEAATLSRLNHPNIVYFIGAFIQEQNGYIVCEYCECGSLRDILSYFEARRSHKPLVWKMKMRIALCIARGLDFLHQSGIVHGDMKSGSVLVCDYLLAKVGDFGTAQLLSSLSESRAIASMKPITTIRWTAPEVLQNSSRERDLGSAVDVYAFGIILWEILTLEIPFKDVELHAQIHNMVTLGQCPKIPLACSIPIEYVYLMQSCWTTNPKMRPCMPKVIEKLQKLSETLRDNK